MSLKAPMPFFGGKSAVAPIVWKLLGQPSHYIEPFFGSGAVLLARPNHDPTKHTESVCDKDGFLANVWRALQFAPDEVARWCDWPVNHADLNARRRELIKNESRLIENLTADPKWFDATLAGYWIWAASCWIGSGLTCPNAIPHLGNAGMGVHKIGQIPHLGDAGKGVHKIGKIPHLGNAGRGVHKTGKIPHLGSSGMGVQEPYNTNIYTWFRELSERLRYVRVVCGDWSRVCGGDWQDNLGEVGIFFDPPYSDVAGRNNNLYQCESKTVAHDVREWCIERGEKKSYKIVLAGYYEEHKSLLDIGWKAYRWSAGGGYSNAGKGANLNRHKETLFYSPHCNALDAEQGELF